MKEKRRRGLGDLPEPHGRLRGEYPFPEYRTKLPPRQEARYPAVPSIQPDTYVPGQDVQPVGTVVQSVWNVRPINAVDFLVTIAMQENRLFTEGAFIVPAGRVLVMKEISWSLNRVFPR